MIVSYYPGCTLKNVAKELDKSARACAEALGIQLQEIPEWQCCGGCYPAAKDEIAPRLAAVRALAAARDADQALVSLCSACHNVLKRTNFDLQTDPDFRDKVNRYLAPDRPYQGEAQVLHFAELLRDKLGFEELKKRVKKPLTGQKIGAYYGCLLLRPGKVMAFDDPENPRILEDLIRALGAEPVLYPERNECCGGYLTLEDPAIPKKRSLAVLESARAHGAETLITACPLCRYNLEKNGGGKLRVAYLTELLAEALEVE